MKDDKSGASRRSNAPVVLDPNLPRIICQSCRHALCVVGVEGDRFSNDPSRSGLQTSVQGSMLGCSRMDNSFVVLPKQKGHLGKAIEDSFIVLPPPAASIYKNACEGVTAQLSATVGINASSPLHANSTGFDSTITILERAFAIATSQMQIDQPLCLECMHVLSDKLDKEFEDVNRDIKAYESYLQSSGDETSDMLSEADFEAEKLKLEEEERRLIAMIEETKKQCIEVNAELGELDSKTVQFKELEDRYWHEFNHIQLQIWNHQEERDAILAKIEVSQAHLEALKQINVLSDAFTIWHDGEFGTISNFRLGRLPKIQVEWDEINAAWGQACLLLHIMAQYFPKFPYRNKIIPMGSYPRILDCNKNSYELFGPVNLFWSTRYDKAMSLYLTCLNDFADFAHSMDRENNIPSEKCFKLPYKIENDRVGNYTITQSFNQQELWTKALKYTLCNLKWVLFWFIGNSNFQPPSSNDVSNNASLHIRQPVNSK